MKVRWTLAALALVLLGAAATWATLARRVPAPEVSYTLLDGQRGSLSALRGHVVLVNFWSTSCAVCVAEMPQVVALHARHRAAGLATLAVAMPYDPPALVARYAQAQRLPFGVVIDLDGAVLRGFGDVPGTPAFIVLDKRGRIAQRVLGAPDFAALDALIRRLQAEV
ncbi:MAG TPA: TlpA disulfide reductase family protein [Burkholderiaceae bacterium]|nr:TlpA disulfide reductase family protein [Burkholderiaceae bacterium]